MNTCQHQQHRRSLARTETRQRSEKISKQVVDWRYNDVRQEANLNLRSVQPRQISMGRTKPSPIKHKPSKSKSEESKIA